MHRQCDIKSTTQLSCDLLQISIPVTSLSCKTALEVLQQRDTTNVHQYANIHADAPVIKIACINMAKQKCTWQIHRKGGSCWHHGSLSWKQQKSLPLQDGDAPCKMDRVILQQWIFLDESMVSCDTMGSQRTRHEGLLFQTGWQAW